MVPLDRGPCVSSRPFAYFFLKCAPLPHKTITAQSRLFCCSAVLSDPYRRFGLFASSNFVFISLRGSNERPLSRIRLSPPTPAPLLLSSRGSCEGLKRATPVEDSALRGSNKRPLSRIRFSPPTPAPLLLSSGAPICDPYRGSGSATFVSTPSRGSTERSLSRLRLSPPDPHPLLPSSRAPLCHPCRGFGSVAPYTSHSIVIASVVRAPRMCSLLTTLGGRAGYGKSREHWRR